MAVLTASEGAIYQRFGFGVATTEQEVRVDFSSCPSEEVRFVVTLAAMQSIPDTLHERLVLQDLDRILRDVTELDPRPYTVGEARDASTTHDLAYAGDLLTPDQEAQVRHYIAFLRSANDATHGQEEAP